MRQAALDHVEAWVFDLDNTLYPASCNLFAQIDVRMKAFIREVLGCGEARAHEVQKAYFLAHGTTLRGLMDNHGVDPEIFLARCHEIDHSVVPPSPALDAALHRLDGRKLIFTNGSVRHAEAVTGRRGVPPPVEARFDSAAADYVPKPAPGPYRELLARHDLDPRVTAFVEDSARNLLPAHELGMTTIWVRHDTHWATDGADGEHVHHETDDLVEWLEALLAAREAGAAPPAS